MTATWTAPATITDGDLVDATWLNTNIRDNMDWLKGRPYASAVNYNLTFSTTSTSLVDVTGASLTLPTTGGRVMVAGYLSGTGLNYIQTLLQDGANLGNGTYGMLGNGDVRYGPYPIFYITGTAPSAGSHTWKVQVKTANATYASSVFAFALYAWEVGV